MPRGSRRRSRDAGGGLRDVPHRRSTPKKSTRAFRACSTGWAIHRPLIINEDGVSTLNLHAAVQEHVSSATITA